MRVQVSLGVPFQWGIGTVATAPALQAGLSRIRVPHPPPKLDEVLDFLGYN